MLIYLILTFWIFITNKFENVRIIALEIRVFCLLQLCEILRIIELNKESKFCEIELSFCLI